MSTKKIIKAFLAVPAALYLIMIRPLRRIIKFELMIVAVHRYGHLALEPEAMLCRIERGLKEASNVKTFPKIIRLWSFGPRRVQSNRFLVEKWREVVLAVPSWLVHMLFIVGERYPAIKIEAPKLSIQRQENALDEFPPHLSFSAAEIYKAEVAMHQIGINPNQKYVCLVVRDGGHYKALGITESPIDEMINFDITDFEMAAVALVDRGYQVVRMGAGTEKPFAVQIDGVFDYSLMPNRSEFLDVFLAANCEFALSTQTGPDCVSLAFRRPVCYVDVTRFSQFFFGTELAYWSPSRISVDGRALTLREIVSGDLAWLKTPEDFANAGLNGTHSTPEEIRRLAIGFVDLLEQDFKMTTEDLAMSNKAKQIIADGLGQRGRDTFGRITAIINPAYLREYGDWFLS